MLRAFFGGRHKLLSVSEKSNRFLAVRTHDRRPAVSRDGMHSGLPLKAQKLLGRFEPAFHFPAAGVQVLRLRGGHSPGAIDEAKGALRNAPATRFAARVLSAMHDPTPLLYTENLFLQVDPSLPESRVKKLLAGERLTLASTEPYAPGAYFAKAREGAGRTVFATAEQLLRNTAVRLCHPELIRPLFHRQAGALQWHLGKRTVAGIDIDAHASVEAAWGATRGGGVTIAIIDDGIDAAHAEFQTPGKIVSPRDVTLGVDDASTGQGWHGTAAAGVACASGTFGASGVAPDARLMPIRQGSGVGAKAEADAIYWAARNGADVISCSWGPGDGDWRNPNDPIHQQVWPIPDHTRLALQWAAENGRRGLGIPVFWAAGNGNELADNDGYASCEFVLAVAATNDRGLRASYSDYGAAIFCAFPSNDPLVQRTSGIWTTDRRGAAGYNPGIEARGDRDGNYLNCFGGTSSAAPGAAAVAALVLSKYPNLTLSELRARLRIACDPIDPEHGAYADGRSRYYGYGLVNAARAVLSG